MWLNPTNIDNMDKELICVKVDMDNSFKALTCKIMYSYDSAPEIHAESFDTDTGERCFVLVGTLKDWIYKQYLAGLTPFFFMDMEDAIKFMAAQHKLYKKDSVLQ